MLVCPSLFVAYPNLSTRIKSSPSFAPYPPRSPPPSLNHNTSFKQLACTIRHDRCDYTIVDERFQSHVRKLSQKYFIEYSDTFLTFSMNTVLLAFGSPIKVGRGDAERINLFLNFKWHFKSSVVEIALEVREYRVIEIYWAARVANGLPFKTGS